MPSALITRQIASTILSETDINQGALKKNSWEIDSNREWIIVGLLSAKEPVKVIDSTKRQSNNGC